MPCMCLDCLICAILTVLYVLHHNVTPCTQHPKPHTRHPKLETLDQGPRASRTTSRGAAPLSSSARTSGLEPESCGQSLALSVFHVPYMCLDYPVCATLTVLYVDCLIVIILTVLYMLYPPTGPTRFAHNFARYGAAVVVRENCQ